MSPPLLAAAPPRPAIDLNYLRGALLVILAGTFWSTGGVLVKLVEAADARQIVVYRSLTVLAFLAVVLLLRYRATVMERFASVGRNGILGGLCLAGAFTLFIEALTRTTVANALFILAAQPFITALLGRLILGEAVRRTTWLAMAIAVAGIAIMVAPGLALGGYAGSLLAFGSAVCFSLFSVSLRRAGPIDTSPVVVYAALFSAAFCSLLLVLGGGAAALRITAPDLLACIAMGVVQIGFGMLAYTAGARYLPAADLTILALTEVVLGPVWAWLIVHEVPATWTLVGGACVLLATVLQAGAGARGRAG